MALESSKLKDYLALSKSGIVALVLISVLGGFLSGYPLEISFDWLLFTKAFFGILLLASGSSALNQVQEIKIDLKMDRTANRPLPSGRLSKTEALIFVLVSLMGGGFLLWIISMKVFLMGVLAVISYNFLYTLWWKKNWAFAAIPGALPGALPILMGYTAATGEVWTHTGIYLFAILFFWQMPHFWVLALKYKQDYFIGGIPTLPVSEGKEETLFQIVLWCLAYIGLILIGPFFLEVGLPYWAMSVILSIKLLFELRRYIQSPDGKNWIKFFLWINFSLILILLVAVADRWSIYLLIPLLTT